MENVIIIVHLMIVIALVGVVLLQRSEGGGLGIGGGSGFMTARGAANALTRSTGILAAAFFATSLLLSVIARYGDKPTDILDLVPTTTQQGNGTGVLDAIGGAVSTEATPAVPAVPTDSAVAPVTPAAPATPATPAAPATPAVPATPATPAVPNN